MKKHLPYRSDFNEWLPERPKKRKQERIPVTVCVAAICRAYRTPENEAQNLHMIVGAADRMLTGGDLIEFEQRISNKIVHFSSAIVGMFAGDFGLQYEILQEIIPIVGGRIKAEPNNWWLVKEVAELYAKFFKQAHLKRSENAILAPLGLDINSFITNQKVMNTELVKQIASKLAQFDSPGVEAIFCGLDSQGHNIYVVNNSADVICHNAVGFAAIGIGAWHANSQFMFAEHHWQKEFAETLLLTYSAKKRAEVAPGVGEDTDMFLIGPLLGQRVPTLNPDALNKLQDTYESNRKQKQQADKKSQGEIQQYIDGLIERAKSEKQNQESASPSSSTEPPTSDQTPPAK